LRYRAGHIKEIDMKLKNMLRLTHILSAAAVLFAGIMPVAKADTIFSNITTPDSFPGGRFPVIGPQAFGGIEYQAIGEEFTPTGNATLTETEVIVGFFSGEGDPHFNESLYTNNNGLPGTLVQSLATDLTASSTPGAVDVDGLSIALTAGSSYWLVLTPFDGDTAIDWDDEGSSAQPEALSNSGAPPSAWTHATSSDNVQFAIDGTLAPTSAVPEPSSFVLLVTGLAGAAGVARRRFA